MDAVFVDHSSVMKGAIPVLPVTLAWLCLVFNVIIPGAGNFYFIVMEWFLVNIINLRMKIVSAILPTKIIIVDKNHLSTYLSGLVQDIPTDIYNN